MDLLPGSLPLFGLWTTWFNPLWLVAVGVAIAVVLIGHLMNLVLCIMSGVVHGLRLNCIEFLKWSLPEEGHLFTAFSKRAR